MNLFYRALALIYVFAFVSLYVQFPGLYGWNGLQPIDQFLARIDLETISFVQFPTLLRFAKSMDVSEEGFSECLLLVGICTSFISFLGFFNWATFGVMWAIYLSFLHVGQSFMSFQWDILLVEVGFLAAVSLTLPFKQYGGPSVSKLLFRFILWKLMFMAGVVKVFSNCPTWLNLTALEYHFATQPLANALSWYAHQLHPVFLRAGVAITLLVEIPLTFLCIGQFRLVRQVGVVAQVLLQIMIISTGSYNFFNILTIALTIPVWADDIAQLEKIPPEMLATGNNSASSKKVKLSASAEAWLYLKQIIKMALIVNVIAMCGAMMFELHFLPRPPLVPGKLPSYSVLSRIQVLLSANIKNLLPQAVRYSGPIAVAAVFLKGVALIFSQAFPLKANGNARPGAMIYRVLHCMLLLCFMSGYLLLSQEPLGQINSLSVLNILPVSNTTRSHVTTLINAARPFHISSGYGLFRTMTGVGRAPAAVVRVGDLAPSIVARPEIVLEGFDEDLNEWRPIEFLYKPSDVMRRPPFAAPHQPRLDWQMWFAALSSYQREPWLINLVDKLLAGGEQATDALSLLDAERYPFKTKPPKYIQAFLYHYDFTRYNSSWVKYLESDSKLNVLSSMLPPSKQPWWTREKVSEYLPALEKNNPSVAAFLSGHMLVVRKYQSPANKYNHCVRAAVTPMTLVQYIVCYSIKARSHLNYVSALILGGSSPVA